MTKSALQVDCKYNPLSSNEWVVWIFVLLDDRFVIHVCSGKKKAGLLHTVKMIAVLCKFKFSNDIESM